MGDVLAKIEKNSAEEIHFAFVEWKQKKYLDIRVWVKADPDEGREEQPTKKGVRFNVELLEEFIEVLQKINAGLAFGPGEAEETKENIPVEEETDIPF